jgi:hypothetical protein
MELNMKEIEINPNLIWSNQEYSLYSRYKI